MRRGVKNYPKIAEGEPHYLRQLIDIPNTPISAMNKIKGFNISLTGSRVYKASFNVLKSVFYDRPYKIYLGHLDLFNG